MLQNNLHSTLHAEQTTRVNQLQRINVSNELVDITDNSTGLKQQSTANDDMLTC